VRRLEEGRYDAILVARAGLIRLGLDLPGLVAVGLDPDRMVPAPGQGALALQVRREDETLRRMVEALDAPEDARRVAAERGLLARLEGGCHLPLGAHVVTVGGGHTLVAFLGATEVYGPARRTSVQGSSPEELVETAFRHLVDHHG
jgi:hydroxymethylbilane synthase